MTTASPRTTSVSTEPSDPTDPADSADTARGAQRAGLLLTAVLAGLSMFGPFNIDAPLPAFAEMGREFEVTPSAMQQVVSVYLLSFAAMSLFHGPLSDALGRRPVMLAGIAVYVLASIGCALSPSLPVLLAFRALQGLSAGAGQIISRAVVRDLFSGDEAQRLMSHVSMIFGLAPAIAPVIGGALLGLGRWSLIFWFLAAFGVLMAVAVLTSLPETLPTERRTPLALRPVLGSLGRVLRDGPFMRLALAATSGFAGQFLFIANAPLFINGLLALGEGDFWVFFVPMISCMVLGSWISGRLTGRVRPARQASVGIGIQVLAATIGVVIAHSPAAATLPWAVVGPSLTALGTGLSFPVLQLALLDRFPDARGAAASGGSFVTLLFNAALAGLIGPAVATSLGRMSIAALCLVSLGAALWAWHLAGARRRA